MKITTNIFNRKTLAACCGTVPDNAYRLLRITRNTKLIDIIYTVRKMKWSWAGHINRLKDDRWTSRVTTWRPYDKKRRQGRPAKRWRDDLDKYWSDAIWQKSGSFGDGMLRPSLNHGTQRLPNDDDDDKQQHMPIYRSLVKLGEQWNSRH